MPLISAATPLTKSWQMTGALGRTLCVQLPAISNQDWFPVFVGILTGYASFPYQTLGSSNGVTAGMDGVNRINAPADMLHAATPSSARGWWVGKNPSTGVSWCFHNDNASGEIVFSNTSAFTGGSTTARPTASDEAAISVAIFSTSGSTNPKTICVWHSLDGKQTMFVCHGSSFAADSLSIQCFMGDIHGAPTAWDHPTFVLASTGDREGVNSAFLSGSGGGVPSRATKPTSLGGGAFSPYFAIDAIDASGPLPTRSGAALDGARLGCELAMYVNTSGFVGPMGVWPDVHACAIFQADVWVAFAGVGTGTNGNAPDLSRNRCLIGTLLYPWDGGAWTV